MKKFITETVRLLLMPATCPDRGGNYQARAFRCAPVTFLVLGLLGGIGNAQEAVKIDSTGDVSIAKTLSVTGDASIAKALSVTGDANIAKTLSVTGNANVGTLNFGNSLGDKIALYGQTGSANYGFSMASNALQIHTDTTKASIVFGVQSGTTFTETMRIMGTGDVLMGAHPIKFSSQWSTFPDAATNQAEISNDTDAYKSLMIAGNRSSGVRSVSIYDNLKVHGALAAEGRIWTKENGSWRRVGTHGLYDDTPPDIRSDVRLKTDLLPIRSPLDDIRRLNGVTYKWNDEALKFFTKDIETTVMAGPEATAEENQVVWHAERNKRYKELSNTQVGVVAQDVEAVLPQAVTTDASGYKSVKYYELIPLVIEALKEEDRNSQEQGRTIANQQAEIQRLTVANNTAQQQLSELQELKQKLAYLEASVSRLVAEPSGDRKETTNAGQSGAMQRLLLSSK